MNYRYLFGMLALVLVPLLQVVSASVMSLFSNFSGTVVALVFLIMLARPQTSIYFVIISGLMMDMHAQTGFGVFLLVFATTAIIIHLLHLNFFTNRSLYSLLLLTLIATILFHLVFIGVVSLYYALGWHNSAITIGYWKEMATHIIGNIIIALPVFISINRFSNLFKPTYLSS